MNENFVSKNRMKSKKTKKKTYYTISMMTKLKTPKHKEKL